MSATRISTSSMTSSVRQNLTRDDFTTRKVEQEGKVMLKYSTKITP